jgi:hypothetical protein
MFRQSLALGLVLALVLGPVPVPAEPGEGSSAEPPGPSVPVVTLDAVPLPVPLTALPGPARGHAEAVLGRAIFAQQVTGIRFPSQEPVYRFLLDHPDFAASVVRALRLGEYRVTPREDGYWGDDARGAAGTIRVLYGDDQRRLFHLDGRYERRWWPTIEGQILVLLEFRHEPDETGLSVVEQTLTAHVRLDGAFASTVAQVLQVLSRPAVERAVESKVRRFFRTVARVSRWAHDQPEQLAAALDGHPEVEGGPTLAAFRTLLLADRPPAWARGEFRLIEDPSGPAEDPPVLPTPESPSE